MKLWVFYIFLISLHIQLSFAENDDIINDDKDCDVNYECAPRDQCQWYQDKLIDVKDEKNYKLKNEKFEFLRSLVCNRVVKKICCPLREGFKKTTPNV